MSKFVTFFTAISRLPRERYHAPEERRVPTITSLAKGGDSSPADHCDEPELTQSETGTAPRRPHPSFFSPEGVARARGFWLIVLLVLNLGLWVGLGWIVVRLLE